VTSGGGGRFHGALQIIRFNWPYYAVTAAGLLAWPAFSYRFDSAPVIDFLGWVAWAAILWWTVASITASHWIYDRSPLMKWSWIRSLPPARVERWANIHSGLDESTDALKAAFPGSAGVTFDLFDPLQMTEPSIRRAREGAALAVRVDHAALPLREQSLDCVFLLFAAHELRAPDARDRLFREVARVLAPGGRLILAEHVRDLMNVAAFGPGAWHFLPRREWLRVARCANLEIDTELTITPFVRVWSLRRVKMG
jgi:SAM-dependent methyltransferase